MKIQGRLLLVSLALVAFVCVGGADNAFSENYPTKEIRLIVPFPPGGANDVMARIIGKELTERLGQPVLVENRPGAGGTLGTGMVAKATPDGYTILFTATSFNMQMSMYSKLPYNTIKDFAGIVWVATGEQVLAVHPSLDVKSVKELIALAKAKPGQLNYASSGIGSSPHLRGELFKSVTGTDIVHIPYKGTSPLVLDLLAGRVSLSFTDMFAIVPYAKAGKLQILAVTGLKRSPILPDVPTMTEAGVSGFESGLSSGIVVPAATPKQIVAQLNTEIVKILRLPDVKERFNKLGLESVGSTPEEFDSHIKVETAKWAKVIKDAGIPVEN